MYKDLSFIEGVLEGEYLLNEIDDFIDQWHDSDEDCDITLREFLGMTQKEYQLWASKGDSALKTIVSARKKGISLDVLLAESSEISWAARSNSSGAANQISHWISKRTSDDE